MSLNKVHIYIKNKNVRLCLMPFQCYLVMGCTKEMRCNYCTNIETKEKDDYYMTD